MKKMLMSVLFILLLSFIVFVNETDASRFTDLPENNYYAPYVYDLVEKGYVSGYPDGTFRVNKPLTRAEASQMLAKFGERYYPMDQSMKMPHSFNDVKETSWYFNAVYSLALDGIVNGYQDGQFYPQNNMTRGEVAKVIRKMIDLNEQQVETTFLDIKGHFAQSEIEQLASIGLLLGKDGNHFMPNDPITRGQLAVLIYRLNVQKELILAGDHVDAKLYHLIYKNASTEQILTDKEIESENTAYFVRGKDMTEFLKSFSFEDSMTSYFKINEASNYIATHNVDANCSAVISEATFSLGNLVINLTPFSYFNKIQTGEEMMCTAVVNNSLEVIEIPATIEVKSILKTYFPYRYESNLDYKRVLLFKK